MSQPVGRRGIADSWPKNERCTYCGNLFGEHPIQSGEQICHGQRLELPPSDDGKPYTQALLDSMADWKWCPVCGERIVWLTPQNRGIAPLPGILTIPCHSNGTELCPVVLLVTARAGLEDRERLTDAAQHTAASLRWWVQYGVDDTEMANCAGQLEALAGVRSTPGEGSQL